MVDMGTGEKDEPMDETAIDPDAPETGAESPEAPLLLKRPRLLKRPPPPKSMPMTPRHRRKRVIPRNRMQNCLRRTPDMLPCHGATMILAETRSKTVN